ncbi:peptidase M23 [Arthrobacter sp. Leaf337]|uniref:M23 family metallopeptidase n=1 Tax=Arthrobacter sp. Leaf337 TaxID=1736342 RepID=UPI0006F7B77D|nr:M23 family metallopeptidase [Arthrobacter sp. Leaf337]KQR64144.1 peptidase M23 [Arthrobacter sp. Leaf337]
MAGTAAAALLAVGLITVVLDEGDTAQAASSCTAPSSTGAGPTPAAGVAGFDFEQIKNARAIMDAAKALGLPVAAQLIGIQAATGESTLRVADFGDGAGPDSRGLFQQRSNGAWGSYADRMDPTISATNFFKALQKVERWETLEPTIAIHRTQRNADPNHYTKFRAQATEVFKALGGESASAVDPSGVCPAAGNQVVGDLAGRWVKPMEGAFNSSGYGPRPAPSGTAGGVLANFHYGIDFVHPGGPGTIVAITDMKIVKVRNLDGLFGTGVTGQTVDGKLTIGMYHMEAGSVKVKEGDTVAAGTPLGTEGATGNVTGRHLHMEFFAGALPNPMVPINPTTDPTPILKEKGIL